MNLKSIVVLSLAVVAAVVAFHNPVLGAAILVGVGVAVFLDQWVR